MITHVIFLRSFTPSSLLLIFTQKCSRSMEIFFFDSFSFNSIVGLFKHRFWVKKSIVIKLNSDFKDSSINYIYIYIFTESL
jgi:hypothetical protein